MEKVDDTVSRFKEFEGYKKDAINPDHYKNETSLECIEAMKIVFGRCAVVNFCLCNAWKYIWRWRNKHGQEDLKKARWYLNHANDLLVEDYDLDDGYNSQLILQMFEYIEYWEDKYD